jgi:hypothetical protein
MRELEAGSFPGGNLPQVAARDPASGAALGSLHEVNRETLFLRTLDDLGRRVQPAIDEYEVLLIAGLLRKLLLDKRSLIDQVNRERRLRIRYVINASRPVWESAGSPPPVFWSIQDGLDPETALTAVEPKAVSRDELLAKVVMRARSEPVSVKDVILHTANVVGAVHAGESREDVDRLLEQVANQLSLGGYRPDVLPLQAIGRVVLRAMTPLREQIEREARS